MDAKVAEAKESLSTKSMDECLVRSEAIKVSSVILTLKCPYIGKSCPEVLSKPKTAIVGVIRSTSTGEFARSDSIFVQISLLLRENLYKKHWRETILRGKLSKNVSEKKRRRRTMFQRASFSFPDC